MVVALEVCLCRHMVKGSGDSVTSHSKLVCERKQKAVCKMRCAIALISNYNRVTGPRSLKVNEPFNITTQ